MMSRYHQLTLFQFGDSAIIAMTKRPRVDLDSGSDSTRVASSDLTSQPPDLHDTDSGSEVSEVRNIASNVPVIEAA